MLSHAAKGKVIRAEGDTIVFKPGTTNYELYLVCPRYAGAINEPVELVITAVARKAYTVPSGGLFVSPIMGTPKILQGRVKDVTEDQITLDCGVWINITLPTTPGAIELARGPIESGALVNVVLLAGINAQIAAPAMI